MIAIGDTYRSRSPHYETKHLHIIIAIDEENHKAIVVNVTSRKGDSDLSCVLTIGDHPFIVRESVINYKDALFPQISLIEEAFKKNIFIPDSPIPPILLERIHKGALNSEYLPEGLKQYIPDIS